MFNPRARIPGLAVASIALFLVLLNTAACAQGQPALVPLPTAIEMGRGKVALTDATRIIYPNAEGDEGVIDLSPLASVLSQELELLTGFRPAVATLDRAKPTASDIVLACSAPLASPFDETAIDESYRLTINRSGVRVEGASYKAVVYGTATLLQSLKVEGDHFSFPAMSVQDKPHAQYRGLMIDVARQPHSIATLREAIRLARLYKARYLHLHLTDDQHFTFPFEPVTGKLENNFTYSRKELEELVAYAEARGVTLIPEMDLPGHSSRLRQSGYLSPTKNDYDVADPANYKRIMAIVDDMLSVFHSSPYFHIGGDESGAGDRLVPFLAAVNTHLRGKPQGQKRRLMVWEGFHGAPTDQLPATGEDRVIVHSWESSYNAPWNLLDNGYTLINSSWKPLYVVGNGTNWHPGRGVRMWGAETLYRWDKDIFMHWEPGRAVYEDADPDPKGDRDRTDHQWSAAENDQQDQVLGGQLIFWEQREDTTVNDLLERLPAVAERLWNPDPKHTLEDFMKRAPAVKQAIMPLVRPIEILPANDNPDSPLSLVYRSYRGDEVQVRLRNRSRIKGDIRYSTAGFSNSLGWFGSELAEPVMKDSTLYEGPFNKEGGFVMRAQLFRKDGSAVEGNDWQAYNNWPDRVKVTEFDIGDKVLDDVPDFATYDKSRVLRQYRLPMIRGPINHVALIGQQFAGTLVAPGTGKYNFQAQTRQGHASVYIDLNQDGKWDADELLVEKTPRNETRIDFSADLVKGQHYAVRVDHVTYLPGMVVFIAMDGPGVERKWTDISEFLKPLKPSKNK